MSAPYAVMPWLLGFLTPYRLRVLLALLCLLLAGARFELGGWFHLGLLAAAGCFAWEFWYTRDRDRMKCFKAFLHNHWAGLLVFIGVVLDYALR